MSSAFRADRIRGRRAIFPGCGPIAMGLLALLQFVPLVPAAAQADDPIAGRPKSLLVITLDTTRRDAMGFHGAQPSITPHLDRLASESVIFTDAWTVAPLTLPAHSSLMTGLYPLSHHLRDNAIAPLPPEATTLAEKLGAAGWRTGAAVAAYVLDSTFGLDQGFATYRNVPRDPLQRLYMVDRPADEMVDLALADLAALGTGDAPFFYWLHLFDAHFPYAAPGSAPSRATTDEEDRAEKRRLYLEEIAFVDRELGRLFEELRRRPDWNDLAIVVTADHGESLGDGVEPTHGWFLYDPTMRVPLLVRFPGARPRECAVQASLVDVTPTLLDLLKVPRSDSRFDGASLAPLVLGDGSGAGDEIVPERALALETWYAYANFGWAPMEACVQGPLKYVRSKRERLFDRAADPHEETNLCAEAADEPRARALRMRLDSMLAAPAHSLAPKGIELDEASRRALQAIGYVEASILDLATRPDFAALDDPEDHLDLVFGLERINQYFAEGRPDLAARALRRLCELAPNSAFAHEQLAAMLLEDGRRDPEKLDEAEKHLRIALALDPQRSKSHFELGLVGMRRFMTAYEAGDRAAAAAHRSLAIAEFRRVLEVDRNAEKALVNLAAMLIGEADSLPRDAFAERERLLREALGHLRRFLEIVAPAHPDRARVEKDCSLLETRVAALAELLRSLPAR